MTSRIPREVCGIPTVSAALLLAAVSIVLTIPFVVGTLVDSAWLMLGIVLPSVCGAVGLAALSVHVGVTKEGEK